MLTKCRIYILLAIFLLGSGVGILFPVSAEARSSGYKYDIEAYDVNIQVGKDNVLHITESIKTYFNVSQHGIYREIPVVNHVKRLDGSKDTIMASVENISANVKTQISYSNSNCVIRLGDEDRTVTGMVSYEISYDYAMSGDSMPDKDELYFNIIGTQWETMISNITFTIEMPETFEEEKLGFSRGREGSTNTQDIYYTIDDNTIMGMVDAKLGEYEGLTVRLELPEGYFTPRRQSSAKTICSFLIPIGCLIIAALMWYMVGRDDEVVEVVEFTAPENRNSAEAAFALNGKVENRDIVSLLIYLANKGYLTIEELPDNGLFGSNKGNFRLHKVKDYDGYIEEERIFMEGLFSYRQTVDKDDLKNKFYKTIGKIQRMMNSRENKWYLFEKNSINKGWILILMDIASCAAVICPPFMELHGGRLSSDMLTTMIFPAVGFSVMLRGLLWGQKIFEKIILLIWGLGFGGIPFAMMVWPILQMKTVYMASFIVGVLCIAGIFFFMKYMSKRTKYGNEILGRVRGFKNFLEVAEKDKLEALVEKNPNYFFDILPYAYVFGISDKWMKKFEAIAMEPPTWYAGYGHQMFSMHAFEGFMNSTMTSASSSMTSSPSSSGGGSSGGGSGGGGGGSW